MDLAFSAEEGAFRDEVRAFIAENYPALLRSAMLKLDGGRDPAVWQTLASEPGIPGAALPEAHGGIGITTELAAGHYFKRLTIIESQFGDLDHHLARVEAGIS